MEKKEKKGKSFEANVCKNREKAGVKLGIQEMILQLIMSAKVGIGCKELLKKSGLSPKQISDNVSRLKKKGLIDSAGRGLETKQTLQPKRP